MIATTLREAVERVAEHALYREHTQSLQRVMRDAGGYQHAADVIIRFIQEHTRN